MNEGLCVCMGRVSRARTKQRDILLDLLSDSDNTMTVPVLKPDILRRVVDFALESCTIPNDDAATQLERQECLANLILVSKARPLPMNTVADEQTFKDICTPQLYKDCLVSNVNHFLFGLEKGPYQNKARDLTQVRTLQIYASKACQVATYKDLFEGTAEWLDVGSARGIIDGVSSETSDRISLDYLKNDVAALRVKLGITRSPHLLGSLERVCMTSTGDQSWGTHQKHLPIDVTFTTPALPIRLLCLSSVKHYCQSTMLGPLTLGGTIVKPNNPPKVATFHSDRINLWGNGDILPPIVIGAVNRYMSKGLTFHSFPPDLYMSAGVAQAFRPLLTFFAARPIGIETDGYLDNVSEDTISFADTSIEIYNFIDYYPGPGSDPNLTSAGRLALVQEFVGKYLGKWKGRVVLKEKADCPPCSACGYTFKRGSCVGT